MTNHKGSLSRLHEDECAKTRLRAQDMEEINTVNQKQTESFIRKDSERKREAMKNSTIGGF